MGKKEVKTNAMRILDRKKISYEYQTYECDEFTDGIETADKLNLPHEQVYKTIVLSLIHIYVYKRQGYGCRTSYGNRYVLRCACADGKGAWNPYAVQ